MVGGGLVVKVAVITCSTRSARGERPDASGPLLATMLGDGGHEIVLRRVVPDDVEQIRTAVRDALSAGASVVLSTGGTGLTPTDVTPEAIGPMLDRTVPGIAESLRLGSRDTVPTAVLSRGVAGTIGHALVVTLPGSPGGVRDAMAILAAVLEHAVDQLSGGDHPSARKPARDDGRPVLPTRSADESDVGWGDEPSRRDADWYRHERPPHHE